MPLDVERQVVAPGKRPVADAAPEGPVAGVGPEVTSQFVGPREPPSASRPVAEVGLLACMDANVSLQVRTLCVATTTARIRTPAYTPGLALTCSHAKKCAVMKMVFCSDEPRRNKSQN